MKRLSAAVLVLFLPLLVPDPSWAIQTETVEYRQANTTLQGYLAYDDDKQGGRPGVLVVHDWDGLGEYERRRARELAEMGYLAFALDVYGEGVRPKTSDEARRTSSRYYSDRSLYRKRVRAGFRQLRSHRLTDDRMAVIGFCFGGAGALELARSGANLNGVVTFHGSLSTPDPSDATNIRAQVLVLHGGADPHVTMDDVLAFREEMRRGNVPYQINIYGGAVHAFTVPSAGDDPSDGVAYDARAERRAWRDMKRFFHEIF